MRILKLFFALFIVVLLYASSLTFADHVTMNDKTKVFSESDKPYSLKAKLFWLRLKWNNSLSQEKDVRPLFDICDEVWQINKKYPAYCENGKLLNAMVENLDKAGWKVKARGK
ncbi:MAG: hypothetical protein WC716_16640 [Chitinophagaceae bacterium]|jgi:hypothetical protein